MVHVYDQLIDLLNAHPNMGEMGWVPEEQARDWSEPVICVEGQNLGISLKVIPQLLSEAYGRLKTLDYDPTCLEGQRREEVNRASLCLLLLQPESNLGLNARRFLLLQADIGMIKREMRWIDLSQSWPKNSKSSALWCYRRWVVGQEERMMGEDAGLWRWREDRWGKEREACRRACERHARNYAAWTYRLHLLPEAPGEDMEAPGKMMQRGRILDGLEQEERFSQAWTEEHLVDSSGWNYRRAVLARRSTWDSGFRVVDREVRRVQEMLDRYPGHQVLWNHLQLCLVPPILGQDEKEGNETWRDTLQRTIEWIKGKCTVPQQERWALTALIFLYRQIPDSLVGLIHEDQVQNEWVMRMIRSSSHPSSETKEPFTRANEYHHQTPPHHPMLQARQEQARILMTRQCARKREA